MLSSQFKSKCTAELPLQQTRRLINDRNWQSSWFRSRWNQAAEEHGICSLAVMTFNSNVCPDWWCTGTQIEASDKTLLARTDLKTCSERLPLPSFHVVSFFLSTLSSSPALPPSQRTIVLLRVLFFITYGGTKWNCKNNDFI